MRTVATVVVSAILGAAGFSVFGNATPADSASPYYERQILRQLEAIKYNTGATCEDAQNGFLCKKF